MKIKTTSYIRVSLILPYIFCVIGYLYSLSDNFGSSEIQDVLSDRGVFWVIIRYFYHYYFYWLPPYTLVIILWLLWSWKKPAYKMISAAVLLPLLFTPFMVLWMGIYAIDLYKLSANNSSEVATGFVLGTGFLGLLVSPIIIIIGYIFVAIASIIYYFLKMINLIDNESVN